MKNRKYDLSNDDLEVEMKIQVNNVAAIAEWLSQNGQYLGNTCQLDYYFEFPDRPFVFRDTQGLKDANEWLRVRISALGNFLCFKQCHRNGQNIILYSDEIETRIEEPKKMIKILKKLGYKEILKIKKRRTSFLYGTYRFDIDNVDGLGDFIEIEEQGYVSNLSEGRQRLKDTLEKIGLTEYKEIVNAYPQMLWNHLIQYAPATRHTMPHTPS